MSVRHAAQEVRKGTSCPGQAGHTRRQLAHLGLAGFLGTADRNIEHRSHQVFQHVLSSANRLGSMVMRLTSCLQVIVTLTRPGPRLSGHLDEGEFFLRLLEVVPWPAPVS